MAQHGIMMVGFGILAGSLNYLYQMSMGRLLTPEQYGVVYSLISLLVIVSVFSDAIAMNVARTVSSRLSSGQSFQTALSPRYWTKRVLALGVVAGAILTGLSPVVAHFLRLTSTLYPAAIALTFPAAFVLSMNLGIIQGQQRFVALGAMHSLVGLSKLGFGLLLVGLGFGIVGGLVAIPLAFTAVLMFSFLSLRGSYEGKHGGGADAVSPSYAILSLLGVFSLALLTNIDVVLAKHFLSASDAGNFSAVAVLGKVIFFAGSSVGVAMFPKTASIDAPKTSLTVLAKAIGLASLVALAVILVYNAFPTLVFGLVFRGEYAIVPRYVTTYSIAMLLLSTSSLLMSYELSLGRTLVSYLLLCAAILEVVLMVMFHADAWQLIRVLLVSSASSLLLMLFVVWRSSRAISYNARVQ